MSHPYMVHGCTDVPYLYETETSVKSIHVANSKHIKYLTHSKYNDDINIYQNVNIGNKTPVLLYSEINLKAIQMYR